MNLDNPSAVIENHSNLNMFNARRKTSNYSYETDCDAYAIKKI